MVDGHAPVVEVRNIVHPRFPDGVGVLDVAPEVIVQVRRAMRPADEGVEGVLDIVWRDTGGDRGE